MEFALVARGTVVLAEQKGSAPRPPRPPFSPGALPPGTSAPARNPPRPATFWSFFAHGSVSVTGPGP